MKKRILDTTLDAALRHLDPAPDTSLTDDERARADATLARILASPHDVQAAEGSGSPNRRRSRWLVPAGLVGAAGAAVPALLLSGGTALGSWTPVPEALTGPAASEAAATCLAALQVPDEGERVVIAEQRGDWTYVLLAGPRTERTCLMPEGLVGQENPADKTREGFMGSGSEPQDLEVVPTPSPGDITQTGSGVGSVPVDGRWGFGDDEEWVSYVEGYVGSNVTGITVHTAVGVDVEASVANGRYAAWWPSAVPSSDNSDAMGEATYTVTLANGSKRQVNG